MHGEFTHLEDNINSSVYCISKICFPTICHYYISYWSQDIRQTALSILGQPIFDTERGNEYVAQIFDGFRVLRRKGTVCS